MGKGRIKGAEESAERTVHDAEARLKELGAEAKAKASDVLSKMPVSETKGEQTKRGWFSWLGWSKSKVQEQGQEGRVHEGKRAAGDEKQA